MGKATKGRRVVVGRNGLTTRVVDNPLTTPALIEAAAERPGRLPPGKIEVSVKLSTLVGGLARVPLSEEQMIAAARYRGLWEGAQIGGARAIDYEAVRVDVSGTPTVVADRALDGIAGYSAAVQALGMIHSSVVEKVVCGGMSIRALQRELGEASGHAGWDRARDQVLEAVDALIDHFGMKARPTGRMRAEGARPTQFAGEKVEHPADARARAA